MEDLLEDVNITPKPIVRPLPQYDYNLDDPFN
jgi:hypothetical protein